jgi:hypothetical protein
MECCDNLKCHAVMKVVFGGLLLLNAFVWPKWLGLDGWISWIAVLVVLKGVLMFFHPKDKCCPTPKSGKKK